jgi:hypothetical protein
MCDDACDNSDCNYDDGDCDDNTSSTVIIVLTVVGFVLSSLAFFCICTIIYVIIRKTRASNARVEVMPESGQQLTSQALDLRCPSQDYESFMFEFDDKVCVVCLEE